MIRRIVKMTFQSDQCDRFLALFEQTKTAIRQSEGCLHLELWRCQDEPTIFMTFSLWEKPEHLELYRRSQLFRSTWAKTKPLFADRPQAWSMQVAATVEL